MSILVNQQTRLLIQGITGREGQFHGQAMLDYGTPVVAGVTPGKGGQSTFNGRVPVFNTVAEAIRETGADTSVVYVPAAFAPDAILEAAGAGIGLIFCITEGIPALDMLRVYHLLRQQGVRLVGPNCPGATSVGQAKVGIIPGNIHRRGRVGVVSRSGTLTYEVVQALTDEGIGQSTCVGIGGDPIVGTSFIAVLDLFEADDDTEAVVLIGEIGGDEEERAAAHIARNLTKPVTAFIAGRTAPSGRRMGHAGAIISGGAGTAESKRDALREAGVRVADSPLQIPALLRGPVG
ncbi:MAG: succinate--CoA ligase subunit alpha [Candidatus Limnocylindria bacterium]